MNRNLLVLLIGLLVVALSSRPARAVIDGEVDTENQLSNVGSYVVVSQHGVPIEPFNFGSGSLIHPRVYLTAGHITAEAEAIIASGLFDLGDARISFGVNSLDPDTWVEIESIVTHPGYRINGIVTDENDVGVVILKQPVEGIEPVELAPVGFLDELRRSGALRDGERALTVAGYGEGLSFPPAQGIPADGLRRFAQVVFTVTAKWVSIQQNPVARDGGINNGDSGGPAFWTDAAGELVQVGVHAWAMDAGVSRCVRVDLPGFHAFIDPVIDAVEE